MPEDGKAVMLDRSPKPPSRLARSRERKRERDRRWRRRAAAGRIVVPVELSAGELDWLASVHWLTPQEADAGDAQVIGAAIGRMIADSARR